MRPPSRSAARRQTLICSLVIALTATTVISSVQCGATGDSQPAPLGTASDSPAGQQPASSGGEAKAAPVPAPELGPKSGGEQEASSRRGRSEPPPQVTEKPAAAAGSADKEASKPADADKKAPASRPATEHQKSAGSGKPSPPSSSLASGNKQQLGGKSGAGALNKKLPANLGTVTSTGSGGPAHYMSKHDAYSAIAEKHGALAQDAMRKADKRQQQNLQQRFGGIQKASGLGDLMSPFKGVTDSGLARTLGASMRSIMKGKYSVPAYLASAVLGAVALMAFYESPISPLPVPPLPEPPIGRFPPEMPNISPNLQVPFRMNGQQQQQQQQQQQGQYGQAYQRSFQLGGPVAGQQQPQQQQVLFPGSAAGAQQRQMNAGPVQQLAANLISSVGANRQTAQRKSGLDQEPASSRSFFGSSSQQQPSAAAKLSAPANSQHQHNNQHKAGGAASSILSFLGLGGGSGGGGEHSSAGSSSSAAAMGALNTLDVHRAAGLGGHQIAAGGGPISSASGTEQKGQAALSNSHLVNKMKSYFDRSLGQNIWPVESHAPNQYDQYRRMSIVQALAKDTAFLSSFFTPARRSSNATSGGLAANQLQQSISNVLSAATGASSSGPSQAQASQQQQQQQAASARMQVDQPLLSLYGLSQSQPQQQQRHQPSAANLNTKSASSGHGLMRTADRIGHALLETFTSGLLHRGSQAQADSIAARKSEEQQQQQQNALASATSLISDIMSSYSAQQNNAAHQQQAAASEQQNKQQQQQAAPEAAKQQQSGEFAQSRSIDSQSPAASAHPEHHSQATPAAASAESSPAVASLPTSSSSASQQVPLVRKTRSIGLDYPMEPLQPSRASQINNLVDMVSDSYKQNRLLFSFVMNQVGLSHALPYVDQFLSTPNELKDQRQHV